MEKVRYLLFSIGIALMMLFAAAESAVKLEILNPFMLMQAGPESLIFIRSYAEPILTVLYGIVLIFFVRNGQFASAFKFFLPINIAVFLTAAFLEKTAIFSSFPLLASIIYAWVRATGPLLLVLATGLANQYFSFRWAALLYPFLFLSTIVLSLYIGMWTSAYKGDPAFYWVILAICGLGVLALYAMIKILPTSMNEASPTKWNDWLSFSLLAFGVEFVRMLPENFFKKIANILFDTPAKYTHVMGELALYLEPVKVIAWALCAFLGILLFIFSTRAFFGVGLFVLSVAFIGSLFEFAAASPSTLSLENYGLISLGFVTNKVALSVFVGFILQLAYFSFDTSNRFTAKTAVHFIIFPLAVLFGKFVYNTIPIEHSPLFAAILFAVCGLCVFFLYRIKQKLRAAGPSLPLRK